MERRLHLEALGAGAATATVQPDTVERWSAACTSRPSGVVPRQTVSAAPASRLSNIGPPGRPTNRSAPRVRATITPLRSTTAASPPAGTRSEPSRAWMRSGEVVEVSTYRTPSARTTGTASAITGRLVRELRNRSETAGCRVAITRAISSGTPVRGSGDP